LLVQTEEQAEQEIRGMVAPKDETAKLMTMEEARLILSQREQGL
jgi:hypothetical protein